jgi:hypothetical protein
LDKLDQSSLGLRVSIVTVLALILAAGLFFVKKQDDAARAASEAAATESQNAVTPQTDAGQTYPQTYQAPATSATTGQAETNSAQTPTPNGAGVSATNTTGQ